MGLLVSVRNVEEATQAVAGGADWIDVKEPANGALGAASPATVAAIVQAVGGERPVTVALGELRDIESTTNYSDSDHRWLEGVTYVKVGLAGCQKIPNWLQKIEQLNKTLPKTTRLVAVLYADAPLCDAPPIAKVFVMATRCQAAALLIDTYDKKTGQLFELLTCLELGSIFALAKMYGFLSVAAGRLQAEDFPLLYQLGANIVAVRGAACDSGDRLKPINATKVADLQSVLLQIHKTQKNEEKEVKKFP